MKHIFSLSIRVVFLTLLWLPLDARPGFAQRAANGPLPSKPVVTAPRPAKPAESAIAPAEMTVPTDYTIGPGDVLTVVFWREKDLSSEVTVRPDGRISIPVIQDVNATGLTPQELRDSLTVQAKRYVEDPNVTVIVKEINSRRIYITGQVARPGPYPLTVPVNVVQLIAMAGGLLEWADGKNVVIMRNMNGVPVSYPFNYKEVSERRNLRQNISLRPGDTVIVP